MHTIEELRESVAKLNTFAIDFEAVSTTGSASDAKDPWTAKPTLISIATRDKVGVFDITEESIAFFRELTGNPDYVCLVHNAAYDFVLAHVSGIQAFPEVKAHILDTRILCWAFNEDEKSHGLKYLVEKYCKYRMVSYNEVTNTSPIVQRMLRLRKAIQTHAQNKDLWVDDVRRAKIPYPDYNSPAIGWIKIRKLLIAELGLDGKKDKKQLLAMRNDLLDVKHKPSYLEWAEEATKKALVLIHGLEKKADAEFRHYAADDTKQLFKLARVAKRKLDKEGTWDWVYKIEHEVQRVCIQAELDGMPMDLPGLKEKKEILSPIVDELKERVHKIAGDWEFNPDSTTELPRVLFQDLAITPPVFERKNFRGVEYHLPNLTKGGKELCNEKGIIPDCRRVEEWPEGLLTSGISTARVSLEIMEHPIAQAILDYRVAKKLKSTYLDNMIPTLEASPDGNIHGRFNPIGAKATGRFSSSGPNLQVLPSRGKGQEYDKRVQYFGPTLRGLFTAPRPDEAAPEGYSLIISDLSQIELRLIAHQTADPKLLEVYNAYVEVDGQIHYTGDVHLSTQTSMGIPRKAAKACNFGMVYGIGGLKYARMNRMLIPDTYQYDVALAEEYKRGFFQTYQGIQGYTNSLRDAWKEGQRNFPMLSGRFRHWIFEQVAASKILNSQIQGSAADILKLQIAAFNKYVVPHYPGLRFALQVHDELAYICPNRYIEEVSALVKYIMEFPFMNLRVPLLAGAKVCQTWADAADDNVPEVGIQYARINGVDQLFDNNRWSQFIEADEAGTIELKGAAAMLSPEQRAFCEEKLGQLTPAPSTATFLSREELMAQRN